MGSLVDLRRDAISIFHAGLRAADPVKAVRRQVKLAGDRLEVNDRLYDLARFNQIYVTGAGKASARMASAAEQILGDRLSGGVVNVKYGHRVPVKTVKVNEAGHPLPDQAGVRGAQEILGLLRHCDQRSLVFFLVSGGGSALFPCPAAGLTLEDKQQTTQLLLECGASIQEINSVRKHISQVKGGRLARTAYPATVVSLILSDVVGDTLDSIASGPTVPDSTTFADCLRVIERYGIQDRIPPSVGQHLQRGAKGELEETPKPGDPIFRRVQNLIIGSNRLALSAAKEKANELGYHGLILSSMIVGDTIEAAGIHAAIAKEIVETGNPVPRPACIISGGETTVIIRGKGLGGRNQEFALATAAGIGGLEGTVVLSGGTDGTDGPTDAAGAIVDGTTLQRAKDNGMDPQQYLRDNDSYHFFQALDDLFVTGSTFTNVMDLRLVLVGA
ncbi:MAG TPA: glycerate kinase [Terriglobales bacterium]|nr:glycerate kinase [Terriglobales bacterium]